ncbi:DUF2147 domain-containing protein [Azospirillum sp. sgz302134]
MVSKAVAGIALLFCLPCATALASPDDAFGVWRTTDQQAVVELYPCGPDLCGRLIWYVEKRSGPDAGLDSRNPDSMQRNRRLCGLIMLANFRRKGDGWTGGWVYDPESGNTYSGAITPDGSERLDLRGYIGIPLFGRTEHWTRAPASQPRCQ